jgi:tRNA A37 threonylcarbamoyladenosine modification protein TsaB
LEAIAHGVPIELLAPGREVQATLDAQRRELFLGRFLCEAAPESAADLPTLARLGSDRLIAAEAWLNGLPAGAIVTGGGLDKFAQRLPQGIVAVDPQQREAQASVVGRLAWRDHQSGRRNDLWTLAPVYLRPSYAEEKASRSRRPGGT